jgi:hypothetical protein
MKRMRWTTVVAMIVAGFVLVSALLLATYRRHVSRGAVEHEGKVSEQEMGR